MLAGKHQLLTQIRDEYRTSEPGVFQRDRTTEFNLLEEKTENDIEKMQADMTEDEMEYCKV